MKAIIIEDEQSAADNLRFLLQSVAPEIEILESIETVTDAITYLKNNNGYDLIFMDIHLADGNSFEIVKEVEPTAPIIFTTAYDQYAIQAFKLNSIDYLLKPIREAELDKAIGKFKDKQPKTLVSVQQMDALISLMNTPKRTFRSSFLVQIRETFIPIKAGDFAYFFIEYGVVRGTTTANQTFAFNEKLEDLERDLDPELFFRANRQYLIQRAAIKSLQTYFNGRLVVNLQPQEREKIVVSKANASRLKAWLNHTNGVSS